MRQHKIQHDGHTKFAVLQVIRTVEKFLFLFPIAIFLQNLPDGRLTTNPQPFTSGRSESGVSGICPDLRSTQAL